MSTQVRLTPVFVSLLLTAGFTLHLSNLGHYIEHGHTRIADIVTPALDLGLASWMSYCAVLLVAGARRLFALYDVRGWKRAVYWLVTFYVTASVPGHISYLSTGSTEYLDMFPWWFSPLIMCVYVLFISFMLSLKRRGHDAA